MSDSKNLGDLPNQREISSLISSYDRFVPYQILDMLDKKTITDVKLGDQVEKKLTIMFSDIRDFTTLSETLSPKENFKFINSYLSQMEPLINVHNGVIDKYIGDAIMALFPSNADDAMRCSIMMLKQLRHYNAGRKRAGYKEISIGIGLNTGLSTVGTIGGLSRMEGTVISDAVNLSSRLETLTKNYRVQMLISEHTHHSLVDAGKYCIRFMDRVLVKGKLQPQSIYEVFDEDDPSVVKLKLDTKLLFEEALANYHFKKIEEAKELLIKCLAINPLDRPAEVYKAKCEEYLSSGKFDGAKELDNKIVWNSEYSNGIEVVDIQHKELFELFSKLIEMTEKNEPIETLMGSVNQLGVVVQRHFQTEEEIMLHEKYPFLEHQKDQHAKFLIVFRKMKNEIAENASTKIFLRFKLQILLVDWLINHTLKEDRHFGRFVKYKKD